ncbi:Fur family transcriptional regulator [Methanosarcina siciliae]|uniref:Fur family transcriptional regulator n=1 Tax=Methanosarcina siciliae TaxID=38027 RepID=UPI00064EDB05|nr:Fur family transcriptional regulator [Methanosarcina siciliae]
MTSLQDSDSYIIKALRGKGYKATPQRIAIGRFALHNHAHPTAQRIYNEVKKIYPTVSLATVYKTIQILKEVGLIQELNLEKDQARFDPNMEPHAHLVCLQCKSISDCTDPMISEIVDRMSNKADFSAGEWNFDVYGICSNCRLKKSLCDK